MLYQQAKALRQTSLRSLIVNRTVSGEGFLRSVRSSISDKTKAKLVGIKEKFDFMNVGKAIGGRLGAYAIGRMTGRSGEDMSYFTGAQYGRYGKRTDRTTPVAVQKKNNPLYTKISAADHRPSKKGDGLADSLARIFNLLRQDSEDSKKRLELEKDFEHEREDEREKRHQELLKALGGSSTAKKVEKPSKGGFFDGIMNWLKSQIEVFTDLIKPLLDVAKMFGSNLMKMLTFIGEFMVSPLGLAIAGAGVALYLADLIQKTLEENTQKQFREAGGEKGATAIKSAQDERRGRDVENTSVEQADSVQKQIMYEREAGEAVKLKQGIIEKYMNEKGYKKYPKTAFGIIYGYEYKKNNGARTPEAPESLLKEANEYADKELEKNKVLPPDVTPSTARGGRGSVNPVLPTETPSMSTPVTPKDKPSLTPVTEPTSSVGARVQSAISENKNLELGQAETRTVVIDKSKTVTTGGSPNVSISSESSVPVRNDDETVRLLNRYNLRKV